MSRKDPTVALIHEDLAKDRRVTLCPVPDGVEEPTRSRLRQQRQNILERGPQPARVICVRGIKDLADQMAGPICAGRALSRIYSVAERAEEREGRGEVMPEVT
jgi:hypothetical protein